jgi:V8-like Glu-specific endopeptidase
VISEAAVVITSPGGSVLEAAPAEPAGFLPDAAVASLGDHTLLEAVIGNDDRVKVAPELLQGNPWRQICALRIHSASGRTYVGTAWYIAPGVVATAGHCVFLHDDGGWARSIDVIPAKSGTSEPFGRVRATRFAAVDGWTVQRSRDFDYGVIFLDDTTPGTRVGNFEVTALANSEFGGAMAKVSGYPADLERAEFQFYHERPLVDVTETRLVYDVDTFGGQSGSPIWVDTEELGLLAVGIHTTGGLSSNSGTRITDSVLDNLIAWIGGQ